MSTIAASTFDGMVSATLSDTADDPAGPFAGIFVSAAGTLKFRDGRGQTVTMAACPVGHLYVRCVRVFSTGTGATVFGLLAMP